MIFRRISNSDKQDVMSSQTCLNKKNKKVKKP